MRGERRLVDHSRACPRNTADLGPSRAGHIPAEAIARQRRMQSRNQACARGFKVGIEAAAQSKGQGSGWPAGAVALPRSDARV